MNSKRIKPDSILIDSSLIKWALQESNYFPEELAMHSIFRATYRNGIFSFSIGKGPALASLMGITAPTARKRFKSLLGLKWIVANRKLKIYRIVSTKTLLRRYNLVIGQAALIRISQLKGKHPIAPFIGAFVGFQNKMQFGQRRTETVGRKETEKLQGVAFPVNGLMNGKGTPSASYPKCTDKRLSQNLGCSMRKAQRYKQKAKKAKCIQIEHMARADPGFLSPGEMKLFLKYSDQEEKFLGSIDNGTETLMYLRAASRITSFIPVLARIWVGKRKKVS